MNEPRNRNLVVVTGAGASYDCISDDVEASTHFPPNERLKPPLTAELFDDRFRDILNQYPRAAQIAPSIRIRLRSGEIGLEDYLGELRGSPHLHLRESYWAIPLYLQHLLLEVGRGYTTNPENYDRLITATLELDRVTFITLNYDTIFDNRLAIRSRQAPDSMLWYVGKGRNWSLIKLHGSVNWCQRVLYGGAVPERLVSGATYAEEFQALGDHFELHDEIEVRDTDDIERLRVHRDERERNLYFPTLAVPLRTKQLGESCPKFLIQAIKEHQTYSFEGIDLLVIGYQAIDEDVLDLFRGGRQLRSILVVDKDKASARQIVDRFCDALPSQGVDRDAAAFDGTFRSFAQSSALERFVATI